MVDVTAVGANLTAVQQDETLSDLEFFLDGYGSTRAVRLQLQLQERDIKRLKKRVRLQGEDLPQEQEEEDRNDTEIVRISAEEVDEMMVNLDFFLRTYGSTRAVRDKLASQGQQIVGLRRTVKWLQERQMQKTNGIKYFPVEEMSTKQSAEDVQVDKVDEVEREEGSIGNHLAGGTENITEAGDASPQYKSVKEITQARNSDVKGREVGDVSRESQDAEMKWSECTKEGGAFEEPGRVGNPIITKEFLSSGAVTACHKALKIASEVSESKVSSCSSGPGFPEQTNTQQSSNDNPSATNKQNANVEDPKIDTEKPVPVQTLDNKPEDLCRIQGCNKTIQAYRLCWRHGGIRKCKLHNCNQPAIARGLHCQFHGSAKCRIEGCPHFAALHGQGYCSRHARNQKVQLQRSCKVEGCCGARVGQNYCQKHCSVGDAGSVRMLQLNDSVHQASLQSQAFEGGQHDFGQTSSTKPTVTRRSHHVTCRVVGCMQWVIRDGDLHEYCFNHRHASDPQGEGAQAVPVVLRYQNARQSVCNEPGCSSKGLNSGAKKGYCFRHGGGLTCIVEGCTKSRQLKRLCAAHGGYIQCKTEGCKKRAVVRGRCQAHDRQNVSMGESASA